MSTKTAVKPAPQTVTIPANIVAPNQMEVQRVAIDRITIPKDKRDRTRDDAFKAYIRELAANIAQAGLINPITLTPDGTGFVLIAGECRLEACKLIKWKEIPGHIHRDTAAIGAIRAAENLQRADLDDNAKALVISDMLHATVDQHGDKDPAILNADREQAIEKVAARIGWPISRVRRFAILAELPAEVRALAAAKRLSMEHCRILAMVPEDATCISLAKHAAAGPDPVKEPAQPLRKLKQMVDREMATLGKVTWIKSVPFAGGPACDSCQHNSLNRTGLFEGHGSGFAKNGQIYGSNVNFEQAATTGGVCLNLKCFRAKTTASKGSIRNAGDRIAGKLRELKPAERAAAEKSLTAQAAARCTFIEPTVFGKRVADRIKDRMGQPARKPAALSAKGAMPNPQSPQRIAETKLDDAMRALATKAIAGIREKAEKSPAHNAALYLLERTVLFSTFNFMERNKKNGAAQIRALAAKAFAPTLLEALTPLASEKIQGWRNEVDFDDADNEALIILAEELGVKLPPTPTLEDFLPKAKPAATKSKTSPPAKSSTPKPVSGKKKTKKSKMSQPAKAGGKPKRVATAADVADLHDALTGSDE